MGRKPSMLVIEAVAGRSAESFTGQELQNY
jgi:hypothetical protein